MNTTTELHGGWGAVVLCDGELVTDPDTAQWVAEEMGWVLDDPTEYDDHENGLWTVKVDANTNTLLNEGHDQFVAVISDDGRCLQIDIQAEAR